MLSYLERWLIDGHDAASDDAPAALPILPSATQGFDAEKIVARRCRLLAAAR